MAEAIATLSLVANVMQVVTFARDIVNTYHDVSRNLSPNSSLLSDISNLSALVTNLQDKSAKYDPVSESMSNKPDDAQLRARNRFKNIASDLVRDTAELQRQLQKVSTTSTSRKRDRVRAALRYKFWEHDSISKIEARVNRTQTLLNLELLDRICTSKQANRVRTDEKFLELEVHLQAFIERWSQGERDTLHLIRTEAQATRDHITAESGQTRERIDSLTKNIEAKKHQHDVDEIRRRLLSTLWFPEMNERENKIEDASEDTAKWVFSDILKDNGGNKLDCCFKDWLQSEQPIFYISGKAGSGKSTLSKFLIQNKQTIKCLKAWRPQVQILRFFFFELGTNSLQKLRLGCVRTLLYQIIDRRYVQLGTLLEAKPELLDKLSEHDWSLKGLTDTLIECIQLSTPAFCIFLDGLDEAEIDEKSYVVELVQDLGRLPNVKVCASTRPESVFLPHLGIHPTIRIQTLNENAIKAYTNERLKGLRDDPHTTTDRYHNLVRRVLQKSDGVFLWVFMALSSLLKGWRDGNTWDELEKRIGEFSPSLYGLFRQMWDRESADHGIYRQETAEMFRFALSVPEMQIDRPSTHLFILATCPSLLLGLPEIIGYNGPNEIQRLSDHPRIHREFEKRLSSKSAGLLQVTVFGNDVNLQQTRVEFVHRSAKEFLQHTQDGSEILSYDNRSRREIAICLSRALTLEDYIDSLLNDGKLFPNEHPMPGHWISSSYCTVIDVILGLDEFQDRMAGIDFQWTTPSYKNQRLLQRAGYGGDLALLTHYQTEFQRFSSQEQKNEVLFRTCSSLLPPITASSDLYYLYDGIARFLGKGSDLEFRHIQDELCKRQTSIIQLILESGADSDSIRATELCHKPRALTSEEYYLYIDSLTSYQAFLYCSFRKFLDHGNFSIHKISGNHMFFMKEHALYIKRCLELFKKYGAKLGNSILFRMDPLLRFRIDDIWFQETFLEFEQVEDPKTLLHSIADGIWRPQNFQLEEFYDEHAGIWRPVVKCILGANETREMQLLLAKYFGILAISLSPHLQVQPVESELCLIRQALRDIINEIKDINSRLAAA